MLAAREQGQAKGTIFSASRVGIWGHQLVAFIDGCLLGTSPTRKPSAGPGGCVPCTDAHHDRLRAAELHRAGHVRREASEARRSLRIRVRWGLLNSYAIADQLDEFGVEGTPNKFAGSIAPCDALDLPSCSRRARISDDHQNHQSCRICSRWATGRKFAPVAGSFLLTVVLSTKLMQYANVEAMIVRATPTEGTALITRWSIRSGWLLENTSKFPGRYTSGSLVLFTEYGSSRHVRLEWRFW